MFDSMLSSSKQLNQRINAFNDKTRGIHDTIMKLRYAYSSDDGLKEKMQSVESVMEGLQVRMERLIARIQAVEKLRLQYKLERRYRIRWLIMTSVCLSIGLILAFLHFW
jgi:SMC interacting uncharacterized protein involved in chromosome segregation